MCVMKLRSGSHIALPFTRFVGATVEYVCPITPPIGPSPNEQSLFFKGVGMRNVSNQRASAAALARAKERDGHRLCPRFGDGQVSPRPAHLAAARVPTPTHAHPRVCPSVPLPMGGGRVH